MPAIAISSNPSALVRLLLVDQEARPASQGREGRCIETVAREVASHWTARPSYLVESVEKHNSFTYESVPLKVAGTVRVKYRLGGRLQPLPYPAE